MSVTDRVTITLKAREGEALADLKPFIRLGSTVMIGRGAAVVASASEGDAIDRLLELEQQDHAPALRRVVEHVPTLYLSVADAIKQAALDDGDDEAMAEEAAGQAIRVLVMFKQRLEKLLEPDLLTTQISGSLITENPAVTESMHIDDRVKAVAAEPSFLTVVFKLPNLAAAQPLIAKLPYGQKALGTEAEVFGLTTGNLMEVEACES